MKKAVSATLKAAHSLQPRAAVPATDAKEGPFMNEKITYTDEPIGEPTAEPFRWTA